MEGEYHCRPHASLSGKTPLEVWESDAENIRWVSDHGQLEQSFYAEVERLARNDSTVQWRGIYYEVPRYLRGRKVKLRYSLLDAGRVSLLDANVEIPLRVVNAVANAHRSRSASTPASSDEKPKTGLNAPELLLDNMIRPDSSRPRNPPVVEEPDQETSEGDDHE